MRRVSFVFLTLLGLAACGEATALEGSPEVASLIVLGPDRVVSAVPDTFRLGVPQLVVVGTAATSCHRGGEMVVEEISGRERRLTPYNIPDLTEGQPACLPGGIEHSAWVHFDVLGLATIYIHGFTDGQRLRDFEYEVVVVP